MSRFNLTVTDGILTSITDTGVGSTVLTIPNTVTSFGNNLFSNILNTITEFGFESGAQITALNNGNSQLATSTSLTKVTIPSSVTSIMLNYFANCINLETVIIDGKPVLSENCFAGCGKITFENIRTLKNTNGYFYTELINARFNMSAFSDTVLYDVVNNVLQGVTLNGSTVVTIPNTVTSFGNNLFSNILNTITEFGFESGAQITALNNGNSQLATSTSLTKVTIPSSVTSIMLNYFANCINLETVIIDGKPVLSENCFAGCGKITFDSLLEIVYNGYSISNLGTAGFVTTGLPSLTITNSVLTNIDYSNNTYPILQFKINDVAGVTAISATACQNKTFIGSLSIPSTVTRILANSFIGCNNLTAVTLPGSRTSSSNSLIPLDANSFAFATSPSLIRSNVSVNSLQQLRTQGYSVAQLEAAGFQNVPVTCFGENTRIMCFIDGQEQELMVQDIRNGVLVKTLGSGYKPVCMIGTNKMMNLGNDERVEERLYVCKKKNYTELTEDLIITGCHSVLVDDITVNQREKIMDKFGRIMVTEGKYRLTAAMDERAVPHNCAGEFNIYHFALEHDVYVANYGVYANGLLVESCSKRYLAEISNMTML